jgi:hypothetical protein
MVDGDDYLDELDDEQREREEDQMRIVKYLLTKAEDDEMEE